VKGPERYSWCEETTFFEQANTIL